jgi:hypothetical protein
MEPAHGFLIGSCSFETADFTAQCHGPSRRRRAGALTRQNQAPNISLRTRFKKSVKAENKNATVTGVGNDPYGLALVEADDD